MKIFVIVLWEECVEKHHCSIKRHVNPVVHEFHTIKFEEIEEVKSLKIDPESEMAHNFSEEFFFDKIDDHVKLTDLKGEIEMLKELEEVPALIVPFKLVADLFGHLFFIKGKVLVGDEVSEEPELDGELLGKWYFEELFEKCLSVIWKAP